MIAIKRGISRLYRHPSIPQACITGNWPSGGIERRAAEAINHVMVATITPLSNRSIQSRVDQSHHVIFASEW